MVGNNFQCQHRSKIGKELLELNSKNYTKASRAKVVKVADIFGATFLGDMATIHRMPLLNVLVLCADYPPSTLAIKDATDHLKAGGKKDAPYIAGVFDGIVTDYLPKSGCADLFLFDGASNVQKAGQLLSIRFPHAACYHGGEHVTSLFFSDLAKLPAIKVS